jgi:hypothetical protein
MSDELVGAAVPDSLMIEGCVVGDDVVGDGDSVATAV